MDIRKLTISERNNPFILLKNKMDINENDVLRKIQFNNKSKTFSELESFVILMRFLKKDENFINQATELTPLKEDNLSYFINSILNDVELQLTNYADNNNALLKESLYDSQTLTGYNFNENISQYRNCSSILINDFKTMSETMLRAENFTEMKESFENKKNLMKSLVLVMKYNDISDGNELGLENELKIISSVLSNEKYKSIKLSIDKPELAIKEEDKIQKPKQDLKYRPKIKRRLILTKPHL